MMKMNGCPPHGTRLTSTTIFLDDKDLPLLLEICKAPDDCHLNHKVTKRQLKRLMTEGLIEVETRRMSSWFTEPDYTGLSNAERYESMKAHVRQRKARQWFDRTEVHACLTSLGAEWYREYWLDKNRVLLEA